MISTTPKTTKKSLKTLYRFPNLNYIPGMNLKTYIYIQITVTRHAHIVCVCSLSNKSSKF